MKHWKSRRGDATPIKRLTPDLTENIRAAGRASQEVVLLHEAMRRNLETVQNNLETIFYLPLQGGGKAEKLDYCVRRCEEIRRALNALEIASFHAIAVKHCCEELWKNIP